MLTHICEVLRELEARNYRVPAFAETARPRKVVSAEVVRDALESDPLDEDNLGFQAASDYWGYALTGGGE